MYGPKITTVLTKFEENKLYYVFICKYIIKYVKDDLVKLKRG